MRFSWILFLTLCIVSFTYALSNENVVDIPTREGVSQRVLVLVPEHPKAILLSYAGGHGGLQLSKEGVIGWGAGNFLVRSREQFALNDLILITVDAPSDKQSSPYLMDFRQTKEHVADAKALIEWARHMYHLPVWLIGTSRGTQSVAYIATQLSKDEGPNGIVLTSTILSDTKNKAVPEMKLSTIVVPVFVVHHKEDGCAHCPYQRTADLMLQFNNSSAKELLSITGGQTKGDACMAYAYHGFNGVEKDVVTKISDWVKAH